FRFYGQDLESSDYFWWIQQRYMNLVSNGLAAYRMVNSFSKHFYHYTKSEERFDGIKLGPHESSLNVPFQRIGNYKDRETMSLKGYTGHANHIYTDTLNSQYEIQAELLGDWVTY